ncbi:MAG: class I SAM-dependent methyltransferase [Bacillota bacterium]
MKKRPDYGIDAPGVIRNLTLSGLLIIALGILFPHFEYMGINIETIYIGLFYGATLIAAAVLMLLYSKSGKFFHRDRIIKMVDWKGDETVLDAGTGRGLLMIAAAKKLTGGRFVGIDIWNKRDLTKNSYEAALRNAESEGVREKIELFNEDVRNLTFPDKYFDVILSNLCLHNIKDISERQKALSELKRVLKPGGTFILSDYKNIQEYEDSLRESGFSVETTGPYFADTFPPLKIIRAILTVPYD